MSRLRSPHRERDRWLVVEGDDDKFVAIELLAKHGAFWGNCEREADASLPYVENANGIEKLRDTIALQAKSKHRLGMMFDADLDSGRAWTQLRRRLLAIESPPSWLSAMLVELPESLPREGLVIESGERALGAWVMPDNGASGALEAFMADLVPSGDIHWEHARQGVLQAIERGAAFKPQHRPKAEIHTWLAWQGDPGLPFGRAVNMKIFNHDSALALAFVSWFRRMFPA